MATARLLANTLGKNALEAHAIEALRIVLVSGCAAALILAGRALPF